MVVDQKVTLALMATSMTDIYLFSQYLVYLDIEPFRATKQDELLVSNVQKW